ncbi:hypothetical protein HNQ88_004391 [Aureibacter tunicatorum]|uniref:Uncharacterized protein n=1 Tax=Aureibacter tunicatorum TaxID=866807 RepID=A0AAE3XSJ2_9BACT|nr:hypothetical protein [Aureibacter tunicatorum]BDD03572.1 hypothetical protein AUTU_10550 [Aureibacter tunicatorum]
MNKCLCDLARGELEIYDLVKKVYFISLNFKF